MRLKTFVFFALLGVVGSAFAPAPATVNISLGSGGIVVSPDTVTLGVGGQVRWQSSGERGARVEIDIGQSAGRKGPFPAEGNPGNPDRGRYVRPVGSPIVTRGADTQGQWKYTVKWIAANGRQYVLDPGIVVR